MYFAYWKLKKDPFGNVPSHEYFFGSSQHEEGLFRMLAYPRQIFDGRQLLEHDHLDALQVTPENIFCRSFHWGVGSVANQQFPQRTLRHF